MLSTNSAILMNCNQRRNFLIHLLFNVNDNKSRVLTECLLLQDTNAIINFFKEIFILSIFCLTVILKTVWRIHFRTPDPDRTRGKSGSAGSDIIIQFLGSKICFL